MTALEIVMTRITEIRIEQGVSYGQSTRVGIPVSPALHSCLLAELAQTCRPPPEWLGPDYINLRVQGHPVFPSHGNINVLRMPDEPRSDPREIEERDAYLQSAMEEAARQLNEDMIRTLYDTLIPDPPPPGPPPPLALWRWQTLEEGSDRFRWRSHSDPARRRGEVHKASTFHEGLLQLEIFASKYKERAA